MSLTIFDRRNLLSRELRHLAERRFDFALSRIAKQIFQVDLVVSDQNGPRGGVDKYCRVTVRLNQARTVVISDKDADLATCISRVADRAARAVTRTIARWKHCKGFKTGFAKQPADPNVAF